MGKYSDQMKGLLERSNIINSHYNVIMNCFGYLMDDNYRQYNESEFRQSSSMIQREIFTILPNYIEEQVKEAYSKMMDDFSKNASKQSEQIGKSIADGISNGFKKAGFK